MRKQLFFWCLLAFSFANFYSCASAEEVEVIQSSDVSRLSDQEVLELMGFDCTDMVEFDEDRYLLRSNTLVRKDMIDAYRTSAESRAYWSTYDGNGVSVHNQTITVRGMFQNQSTHNDLSYAVEQWNSIGSNIQFIITSASNADITISVREIMEYGSAVWTSSDWPIDGRPGPNIYINSRNMQDKPLPGTQQNKYSLMNALGRAIGFGGMPITPSNPGSGTHIPGTLTYDPRSIFIPDGWVRYGFSEDDIKAIKMQYPVTEYYTNMKITGPSSVVVNEEATFNITDWAQGITCRWRITMPGETISHSGTHITLKFTDTGYKTIKYEYWKGSDTTNKRYIQTLVNVKSPPIDHNGSLPSNRINAFYINDGNRDLFPVTSGGTGWVITTQYPVVSHLYFSLYTGGVIHTRSLTPQSPNIIYENFISNRHNDYPNYSGSPWVSKVNDYEGAIGNPFSDGIYNYELIYRQYGQGDDVHWGNCNTFFRSDGSCACPIFDLTLHYADKSSGEPLISSDYLTIFQILADDFDYVDYYYCSPLTPEAAVQYIAEYNPNLPNIGNRELPLARYKQMSWPGFGASTYSLKPNHTFAWERNLPNGLRVVFGRRLVEDYPRPYAGY